MTMASLLGIRFLCKEGCKVVFTDMMCQVIYRGKVILAGYKDPKSDLWTLPKFQEAELLPSKQHQTILPSKTIFPCNTTPTILPSKTIFPIFPEAELLPFKQHLTILPSKTRFPCNNIPTIMPSKTIFQCNTTPTNIVNEDTTEHASFSYH